MIFPFKPSLSRTFAMMTRGQQLWIRKVMVGMVCIVTKNVREQPVPIHICKHNIYIYICYVLAGVVIPWFQVGVSWNRGTPSHHPLIAIAGIFFEIHHPAMGVPPWLWKPPSDSWIRWLRGRPCYAWVPSLWHATSLPLWRPGAGCAWHLLGTLGMMVFIGKSYPLMAARSG